MSGTDVHALPTFNSTVNRNRQKVVTHPVHLSSSAIQDNHAMIRLHWRYKRLLDDPCYRARPSLRGECPVVIIFASRSVPINIVGSILYLGIQRLFWKLRTRPTRASYPSGGKKLGINGHTRPKISAYPTTRTSICLSGKKNKTLDPTTAWLCISFDPQARSLQFRKRDGELFCTKANGRPYPVQELSCTLASRTCMRKGSLTRFLVSSVDISPSWVESVVSDPLL